MKATKVNRVIGRRLKEFRKEKGLNQTELALFLKIHQTALARVEGGYQKLSAEQLYIASKLFGKSMNSFFEENETGKGADS